MQSALGFYEVIIKRILFMNLYRSRLAPISGSYWSINGGTHYYDLVYLGSNLDGSGKSTLIARYVTDSLVGAFKTSSPYNISAWYDANAQFRTAIQTFIDANFSQDLLGALQSVSKVVLVGVRNGTTLDTTSLTAKFFLPAMNEAGVSSTDYPDIKPTLGTVSYSYLTPSFARRYGEEMGVTNTNGVLSRSHYGNYNSMSQCVFKTNQDYNTVTMGIGNANCLLRPLFFLNSSTKVSANANSDGSYSIDWTGISTKTLSSLTEGTIIRDDSGTGRIG